MKTIKVLILEDDIETLSIIFKKLSLLEKEFETGSSPKDFSIVTLSEYTQVEEYINKNRKFDFDVVLLDRDCKVGGSFHILNIEAVGAEKIISISSIPEYNEEAKQRGIKRIVWKDYQNLDNFSQKVMDELRELLHQT